MSTEITQAMVTDPRLPDVVTALRQLAAFVEAHTPLGSLPLLVGHSVKGERRRGCAKLCVLGTGALWAAHAAMVLRFQAVSMPLRRTEHTSCRRV